MAQRKRLGDYLIEAGIIDQFQLQSALGHQRQWGGKLGRILVENRFVKEDVMVRALSELLRIDAVELSLMTIHPRVIAQIPVDMAERYGIVPVALKRDKAGEHLYLAMSDPTNLEAIDEVQFKTGKKVKAMIAGDSAIERAVRQYYYGEAPREATLTASAPVPSSSPELTLGVAPAAAPAPLPPRPAANAIPQAAAVLPLDDDDIPVVTGTPAGPSASDDWFLPAAPGAAPAVTASVSPPQPLVMQSIAPAAAPAPPPTAPASASSPVLFGPAGSFLGVDEFEPAATAPPVVAPRATPIAAPAAVSPSAPVAATPPAPVALPVPPAAATPVAPVAPVAPAAPSADWWTEPIPAAAPASAPSAPAPPPAAAPAVGEDMASTAASFDAFFASPPAMRPADETAESPDVGADKPPTSPVLAGLEAALPAAEVEQDPAISAIEWPDLPRSAAGPLPAEVMAASGLTSIDLGPGDDEPLELDLDDGGGASFKADPSAFDLRDVALDALDDAAPQEVLDVARDPGSLAAAALAASGLNEFDQGASAEAAPLEIAGAQRTPSAREPAPAQASSPVPAPAAGIAPAPLAADAVLGFIPPRPAEEPHPAQAVAAPDAVAAPVPAETSTPLTARPAQAPAAPAELEFDDLDFSLDSATTPPEASAAAIEDGSPGLGATATLAAATAPPTAQELAPVAWPELDGRAEALAPAGPGSDAAAPAPTDDEVLAFVEAESLPPEPVAAEPAAPAPADDEVLAVVHAETDALGEDERATIDRPDAGLEATGGAAEPDLALDALVAAADASAAPLPPAGEVLSLDATLSAEADALDKNEPPTIDRIEPSLATSATAEESGALADAGSGAGELPAVPPPRRRLPTILEPATPAQAAGLDEDLGSATAGPGQDDGAAPLAAQGDASSEDLPEIDPPTSRHQELADRPRSEAEEAPPASLGDASAFDPANWDLDAFPLPAASAEATAGVTGQAVAGDDDLLDLLGAAPTPGAAAPELVPAGPEEAAPAVLPPPPDFASATTATTPREPPLPRAPELLDAPELELPIELEMSPLDAESALPAAPVVVTPPESSGAHAAPAPETAPPSLDALLGNLDPTQAPAILRSLVEKGLLSLEVLADVLGKKHN